MTEENSYPLRITGLVEVLDGPFKGHQWANPSTEHLIELLQHVRSHPEKAKAKGIRAREDMIRRFSPQVVRSLLIQRLERIRRGLIKDEL